MCYPNFNKSYITVFFVFFFKNVALTLWEQLGDRTPQHHQRSVELFYQLHNLVPTSSTCEDVISQQLTHKDKVLLQLHCAQQERKKTSLHLYNYTKNI